jgi:hypothetical protein
MHSDHSTVTLPHRDSDTFEKNKVTCIFEIAYDYTLSMRNCRDAYITLISMRVDGMYITLYINIASAASCQSLSTLLESS